MLTSESASRGKVPRESVPLGEVASCRLVVSITGMIAGGANLICFTTGRGSAYGCKPVPVTKLATNTAMYEKMEDDMDINCGLIADGKKSLDEMGEAVFQKILDTASGKKTKSEKFGFGDNEFVPWHIGAVL